MSNSRKRKDDDPLSYGSVRIMWMGKAYRIPVDADGYVPMEALVMHYQQMGNSSRDRSRDSEIVFPSKAKPKEIVKWWADPSSCDIEGIDTRDSKVYDVSGLKGRRMKAAQRRIGVVTPSADEQRRIRKILSEAFTAEELGDMSKGESFVIRTLPNCGNVMGYYLRKADGQEVPMITLEEGVSPDTVVHETVHHARTCRKTGRYTRTAFPMKGDRLDDAYFGMSQRQRDMINDAEETETTAEATARTKRDPCPTGYWDNIGGREAYIRDKTALARSCGGGDCTLKGAKAVRTVERNYDKLDIAMASIMADIPAKESAKRVAKGSASGKPKAKAATAAKPKATAKPKNKTSKAPSKSKSQTSKTKGKGTRRPLSPSTFSHPYTAEPLKRPYTPDPMYLRLRRRPPRRLPAGAIGLSFLLWSPCPAGMALPDIPSKHPARIASLRFINGSHPIVPKRRTRDNMTFRCLHMSPDGTTARLSDPLTFTGASW